MHSAVTPPEVAQMMSASWISVVPDGSNLFSTTPALIRGSYTAYGWNVNNSPVDYVYNVVRELSGVKYNIVVNFSASQTLSAGFTGTLVAHYNGGSLTSLPPFSAIAVKL